MQGSFALGSGDLQSDCDWLVATHGQLTENQIARLRALHDEVPTRGGHGCHDLEGSYARMAELASVDHLGRQWLFNNHGHRTLEDDHCNRAYTRWILREHGLTLTGPAPESFMPAVPALVLRHEAAASLPTLLTDLVTWIDIDTIAWGQRYGVVTACRILYTLKTAQVASKSGALEWAGAPLSHGGGRSWLRYATNAVSAGNRNGRHARAKPRPPAHSSGTSWRGPSEQGSKTRNRSRTSSRSSGGTATARIAGRSGRLDGRSLAVGRILSTRHTGRRADLCLPRFRRNNAVTAGRPFNRRED